MCLCFCLCLVCKGVSLCMIVRAVCDERCKRVSDEGVWVKGALLILSKDSILIVQSLPVNGSKHLSRVKPKKMIPTSQKRISETQDFGWESYLTNMRGTMLICKTQTGYAWESGRLPTRLAARPIWTKSNYGHAVLLSHDCGDDECCSLAFKQQWRFQSLVFSIRIS